MAPGPSPRDLPGFVPASEHVAAPEPPRRARTEGRRSRHGRSGHPAPARSSAAPVDPSARVPLSSVPLPAALAELIRAQGITELYPPQAEALRPALEGRSVVLCCPTSSGKSLVAYGALVSAALQGRRGIYIVPLRALASEKYRDLKAFEPLGVKVALTMGEHDLSSQELEGVDILIATSEKTDSLLRHRAPWMEGVGVVVADEVHLMRDPSRGPTLEVSLTRLRRRHRGIQVLALSATVGNAPELAGWLDARLVRSDFRPVPLRQGVHRDGGIRFTEGSPREVPEDGDPLESLVRDMLREGGQTLVFVNSRKSTVTLATRLGKAVGPLLSEKDRADLRELARQLGGDSEEESEGVRALAGMVPHGTAFHNASLTNEERGVVEKAFRDRRLRCLVATTTLAAGLNLPARRVIVRDTTRYDDTVGMSVKLPALEVHQMLGRAGRPGLDPYGEALLLAKNGDEEEDHFDRYLTAPPEDLESQLGSASVLRTHLLALVASQEVSTESELEGFLGSTFYGRMGELHRLRGELARARNFLERWSLLEALPRERSRLRATPFGQLASDLYLDPVTAVLMRMSLERASERTTPFAYLAALALSPDLAPLNVRMGEEEANLLAHYSSAERELLIAPDDGELDGLVPGLDGGFLGSLKTASLLEAWTDDRRRLVEITDAFGTGAGDLRSRVERAEWLLSSMAFLAARERRGLARALTELATRVRYGVRPELLELVSLRGIGRVRGRLLFDAGWTDLEHLAHASEGALTHTLGSPALARSVVEQVRRRQGLRGAAREASPAPAPSPGRAAARPEAPHEGGSSAEEEAARAKARAWARLE